MGWYYFDPSPHLAFMYNHAMAGWLRTFFIIFAAVHLLIIAANMLFGPFDPFSGERDLTERGVELGTGFYGVLFGLIAFGWVIVWLIIFFVLRDRAIRNSRKGQ